MRGITFVGAGALAQALAAHLASTVPVTLVPSARSGPAMITRGRIVATGLSAAEMPAREGIATDTQAVGIVSSANDAHPEDVLIFSTKGPQLREVVTSVDPAARRGFVAGLQNGVEKDDVLAEHFGAEAVVGAATIFNARRGDDGGVVVGGAGSSYFGEFSGESSDRLAWITSSFAESGLRVDAQDDIRSLLWMKCVNAIGVFGASALTRLTSTTIMQTPELVSAYVDLLHEAASIAEHEGATVRDFDDIPMGSYLHRPKELVVAEIVSNARANASGPGSLSSMAQDVIAGRRTEAENTFGDLVRRAGKHGLSVPRISFTRDLLVGADRVIGA